MVKTVTEVKREQELRALLPGSLQSNHSGKETHSESDIDNSIIQRERDDLRLEITYWWNGLKEHLTKLVRIWMYMTACGAYSAREIGRIIAWRRARARAEAIAQNAGR